MNNKKWIDKLLNTSSEKLMQNILDALDDNVVWIATGSSAIAGRYVGKQNYKNKVLERLHDRLENFPSLKVIDYFIADDSACIRLEGKGGVGKNGTDFNMEYCWVLKLKDQKIIEVAGYYDSLKMDKLLA